MRKTLKFFLVLTLLVCFFYQPQDGHGDSENTTSDYRKPDHLPAQEEALNQRKKFVMDANDELIQKTLKAHGGNYFRQGRSKVIIFKEKVYKDFSVRVVNGEYIIIETKDGTFKLEVPRE